MFDSTMTEIDLTENMTSSDVDWMRDAGRVEPDLAVDGLTPSLVSRVLAWFGAR